MTYSESRTILSITMKSLENSVMLMIQYEMAFSLSYIFNYHSLTAHLIISSWLNHFAAVAISFSFPPPSSPPLEQIIKLNLQVGTDSFFYIFFYCDCIIRLEFMSHIIIYRLISSWIMYQKQSRGEKKDFNCLIQKFTSRVTFENPDLFFCQVVFDWSVCISAEQTKM